MANKIQSSDNVDLKRILFRLLANWYWLVLGSLVGYTVAYIDNRYTVPVYGVSTTMILTIDNQSSYFDRSLIDGLNQIKKEKNLENEISILKSHDLNSKVIKQLNFDVTYISLGRIKDTEIYENNFFYIDYDTNFVQAKYTPFTLTFIDNNKIKIHFETLGEFLTVDYDEWIENNLFRFRVISLDNNNSKNNSSDKFSIWFNDTESLIHRYKSKLQIKKLSENGTILTLSSSGEVPKKEIDYLNTLTEQYIKRDLDEKHQMVESTIDFIDQQLSDITDSLYKTELRLQNFRLENDVINISREGQMLLSKYESLQNEKDQEVVKYKYLKYLKKQLEEKKSEPSILAPGIAGINDPILTSIISQINQAKSEKHSLTYSTRKEISSITLLDQKISSLEEGLEMNVKSLMEQINIRIVDLNKRIDDVLAELKKQPINERLLLNIQRKFTLNDNIYTYLLEKRAEVGITKASILSDAKVLDAAGLSGINLLYPKRKQNLMIGVFAGLLIPLLLIVILDFLNLKILDRKEVEENTMVPILGGVGHNTTLSEHVVDEKPRSSIAESFRSLKTNLQFMIGEEGSKIISITSGISGEGKTFCSSNLAIVYASLSKKTVIIGLDLRRPKIHKNFNIKNDVGLTNYLLNKASLDEIISPTNINNLDLIPAGIQPPNPNQLIESPKFKELLTKLKSIYDVIVIDTPPVALVSDAVYISKLCDLNVFVIRLRYTTRPVYNIINDLYENRGIKNLAIALNDVKSSGYYGYRSYRYSYGYGYYYGYGYDNYYGANEEYFDDSLPKKPWLIRNIERFRKNKV
ncbi:MAG TPA: polysaccharide biosynthesis tyrosine autokinase [Salinivirgaceae bacterium]|nr:polysaccharide biosynthesis tyrosine autokinase [Salinivirgaceae bacterium]HQA75684.1 polysaccharide biosynthesis tyrosine autokinase [Salinivirgaceae bacterium]